MMRCMCMQRYNTVLSTFPDRWTMQLNMHLVPGLFDFDRKEDIPSPIGVPIYEFNNGILAMQIKGISLYRVY